MVNDGYNVNLGDHKCLKEGKLTLSTCLSKPLEASSGTMVADFIGSNNAWKLQQYPNQVKEIEFEVVPDTSVKDGLIWQNSKNGFVIVTEAYNHFLKKKGNNVWGKKICMRFIPPKTSLFTCHMMKNRIPPE